MSHKEDEGHKESEQGEVQEEDCKEKESTCVIVYGLPRSGTSAVAGVLKRLGVCMGTHFTDADDRNPGGYYEDLLYTSFHASITGTSSFDGMHRTMMAVCAGKIFHWHEVHDRLDSYYRRIISMSVKGSNLWGVKDPRFCFPDILKDFATIASEYANVYLIIVRRNIFDTTNSFRSVIDKTKDTIDYEKTLLAISYLSGMRDQIYRDSNVSKGIINYEDLVARPQKCIEKMADFLDVPVTEEAIDFIDPEFHHFNIGEECEEQKDDK